MKVFIIHMEEQFKKLIEADKNTVDGVIQVLKDCKVIDNVITEEWFRKNFGDVDRVDHETFLATLRAVTVRKSATAIAEDLMHTATEMDEIFDKIQKAGKNTAELLVQWLETSKVLGNAEDSESKIRQLFEDADANNVELELFKQVLSRIAEEQKHSVGELVQALVEQAPKLFDFVAQSLVSK